MPTRPSLLSGSLILATAVSAAGLNAAVIGLNREPVSLDAAAGGPATSSAQVAPAPAAGAPTPVALLSAPVLAVSADRETATGAQTSDDTTGAERDSGAQPGLGQPGHGSVGTTPPEGSRPSMPAVTTSVPPTTLSTTAPTSAPVTTAGPTGPATTEYLTYEFEGIATIVVALHGGRDLEFWSVAPEPGWVFLLEDRGPEEVKVTFRPASGGDEAEFEVTFEDGRLEAKREY